MAGESKSKHTRECKLWPAVVLLCFIANAVFCLVLVSRVHLQGDLGINGDQCSNQHNLFACTVWLSKSSAYTSCSGGGSSMPTVDTAQMLAAAAGTTQAAAL